VKLAVKDLPAVMLKVFRDHCCGDALISDFRWLVFLGDVE